MRNYSQGASKPQRLRHKGFQIRLIVGAESGLTAPAIFQRAMDKKVEVKQTSLQMLSPDELNSYRSDDPRIRIQQAVNCPASFFRYLYREVGREYHWVDRLSWTDDEIRAYLADPEVSWWVT